MKYPKRTKPPVIQFKLDIALMSLLSQLKESEMLQESFIAQNTHTMESEAIHVKFSQEKIELIRELFFNQHFTVLEEDKSIWKEIFPDWHIDDGKNNKYFFNGKSIYDSYKESKDFSYKAIDLLSHYKLPISLLNAQAVFGQPNVKEMLLQELKEGNREITVRMKFF